MFIELETETNTIQLINTDNVIRFECIGNKRPIIHYVNGETQTTGTPKDKLLKLLANK